MMEMITALVNLLTALIQIARELSKPEKKD